MLRQVMDGSVSPVIRMRPAFLRQPPVSRQPVLNRVGLYELEDAPRASSVGGQANAECGPTLELRGAAYSASTQNCTKVQLCRLWSAFSFLRRVVTDLNSRELRTLSA